MATTLATIRTQIRQRCDMVNSQFVTDPELTAYINGSLAELDDLLVETSQDYKLKSAAATIATNADGSNFFTLPADFLKARGVDRLVGGVYVPLKPFQFMERDAFGVWPISTLAVNPYVSSRYRIQDAQCWIAPWQDAAATYRLWYVPAFTALVADGDALQAYMDTQAWHEFAIVDVCAKVQIKQDLDPSAFLAQKQAAQLRIVNAAATRDEGPPKKTTDTRYRRLRGGWGGSFS